jgi:hypothetical protein
MTLFWYELLIIAILNITSAYFSIAHRLLGLTILIALPLMRQKYLGIKTDWSLEHAECLLKSEIVRKERRCGDPLCQNQI